MENGALVGGQITHSLREGFAKSLFIGIGGGCKERGGVRGKLVVILLPGGAAAEGVNGKVMGQADEKSAFLAHAIKQAGLSGELDEEFLQQIPGVGFVAGKIEQKREQSLGMGIVKAFEINGSRHVLW